MTAARAGWMTLDMTADIRFADRYFTVSDGLKLHYRDYPGDADKAPLLCLPGLTRNSRDFAEFAERYSPGRRVVALSFRGRGLSEYDPLPARYVPPVYAADVLQLLDELAIGQAVFVGTSLGGLVTMGIGAMAPQRIAGSILNDVGPELTDAGLERIKSYVGKDIRFPSWEAAAAVIAANNRHLPANYEEADWVRMAHRVCREQDGEIVFDYDMAIIKPFEARGATPNIDMWPLFTALGQKPLLVVRGERSDLLSVDTLARMHQAVPAMTSVTVPGVGHSPMLDEPEALAAIDDFLAKLDA